MSTFLQRGNKSMGTIFLIYIVAQLMTTAFGLAVIDKVQTTINARLHEKGYVLKNKNSLYNFNDGLLAFAKGFIPFYYLKKALDLTSAFQFSHNTLQLPIQIANLFIFALNNNIKPKYVRQNENFSK